VLCVFALAATAQGVCARTKKAVCTNKLFSLPLQKQPPKVTGKAYSEPHVLVIAQWRPPVRQWVLEARAFGLNFSQTPLPPVAPLSSAPPHPPPNAKKR
jgi:hypothetical protein